MINSIFDLTYHGIEVAFSVGLCLFDVHRFARALCAVKSYISSVYDYFLIYAAVVSSCRDRDQRLRRLSVCFVVLDDKWRGAQQQCETLSAVLSLSIYRDRDQRLRAVAAVLVYVDVITADFPS